MINTQRIQEYPVFFTLIITLSALFLFLDARLCIAFWVGLGLTASGSALQGLLQNPLADPYILGVSGGASLFGSIALTFFGTDEHWVIPSASIIGAFAVCMILLKISKNESILLAGLLINAFSSAVISLIKSILPAEKTQSLLFWLLGSIDRFNTEEIIILGLITIIGTLMLNRKSGAIEILSMGDDEAARLGLDTHREKRSIHLIISLLVGTIAAFCGFIGFIGLLVPQITRRLMGNQQTFLIPASGLAGGILLALFDLGAQKTQIPVGVITSLVGTPIFGILVYVAHRKSLHSHDPRPAVALEP